MPCLIKTKISVSWVFLLLIAWSISYFCCTRDVPHIKLTKTDFSLNLPYSEEASPFGKIKTVKMDGSGNFYILDSEKHFIFKFDSSGNFVKLIGGEGNQCGELSLPAGIDVFGDSLLLVQNYGSIDLLDLDGKCQRFFLIRGFADFSISPSGIIVLNRMNNALDLGFFIETYGLEGRQLRTFGPPRGLKYQNRDADFAFTGFTSDNRLVYVPAFLDSIYIYDLDGNILKSARSAIPEPRTPKPGEPLKFRVEDIYVDNDKLFVLQVDFESSTDTLTYVRYIAEYNLELKLQRIYQLPEPLTMSVELLAAAPWYHKFIVRNERFIFMASKPIEHLIIFEPQK